MKKDNRYLRSKTSDLKIIPINWIDETERWIIVPGTIQEKYRRRTKEIIFSKNKCSFATGVPESIIDFIYRAVKQLHLTDAPLIFSRGTVRTSRGLVRNAVSIHKLDWGVGTLVTIPRILKYREEITLQIENTEYSLRLMELVVLHGLLRIAYPGRGAHFFSSMAARILAKGWSQLDDEKSPKDLDE